MSKIYNNNATIGPRVFTYSDLPSVRGCSKNDLIISYKESIIGKAEQGCTEAIFSKSLARLGEQVLIFAKKKGEDKRLYEVVVFAAKIGPWVEDSRKDTWQEKGGNLWRVNYEIHDKTEPVTLSKVQLKNITGLDADYWRICEPRFSAGKKHSELIPMLEGRQKLINFLRKDQ